MDDYKQKYDDLKKELEYQIFRLNQADAMTGKFKKKCWNANKDLEAAYRKLRFMEKENLDLKEKVYDMTERLGEEISQIDEKEQ